VAVGTKPTATTDIATCWYNNVKPEGGNHLKLSPRNGSHPLHADATRHARIVRRYFHAYTNGMQLEIASNKPLAKVNMQAQQISR
jgi:hypothetical protein